MKTKLLMTFTIGMIGFMGIAFAEHDPNQPQVHSIILSSEIRDKTFDEFMDWCVPLYEDKCVALEKNRIPKMTSPLKQIKSGTALIDVTCSEGKHAVYKHNRMSVACVSEETQNELWNRGWSTIRLTMVGENPSHALCNHYNGKWQPEYEGCRGDITDLQCSLMGGEFVDDLKICYNEICPADKTYTLCVTNLDLVSGEKENED